MTVSGIAADGSWLQVSGFQGLSFQELGFQTLTAALGALAFGIVYRVRNERLPVVAAGGGIGWFLYSVIFCRWESIFISNMATIGIAAGVIVVSVLVHRQMPGR